MADIPTTEKLATALEAIGAPAAMVQRARDGYYDDYKSPLATPLLALVNDLRDLATRAAARDLIRRVKDGDFDATAAEARAWRVSPEGRQAMRDLGFS